MIPGPLRYVSAGFLVCSLLGAPRSESSEAASQIAPEIALDPAIECWYHSAFPVLGALVTPPEEIVRSRLYFRCSLYPDYYFVDLTDESGAYRGVAPQAEESCPQVHYYVEALSRDFTSARTEERVAQVTGAEECRRRFPAAAWFTGEDPEILLGSMGATGMAPGFKSIGIAGFISSTGASVAMGGASGGLSGGAIAGIVAGGAGLAGAGVLAAGAGGDDSTTTTTAGVVAPPPPPSTTTSPATTTASAPQAVKACLRLDPPDGIVEVNEPLTIDGRCSEGESLEFHYDLGDGRTREGQAFITAVWRNPGTYNLTLTVTGDPSPFGAAAARAEDSITREIRVERTVEPVTADFTARRLDPDNCRFEFDGSPSSGDIVRYSWQLDLNNAFRRGVVAAEGRIVIHDWGQECFEPGGDFVARLTVTGPDGQSDSLQKVVPVQLNRSPALVESSLLSEMLQAGGARGQISVEGGSTQAVSADAPGTIYYRGRLGRNAIEAVLTAPGSGPVPWRFDFRGAKGFVPGSLRTVSGQEIGRDAYSVVIRLSGAPGERVRIEYRLEDR